MKVISNKKDIRTLRLKFSTINYNNNRGTGCGCMVTPY